jgi:Protein of unknown function (DUF1572)
MPVKKSGPETVSVVYLAALVADHWKREVADRYLPRICDSLMLLSPEEIWWRPNLVSNSIGNLVLHLRGNVRQWIICGLGGERDVRRRDLEFSEKGPIAREKLITEIRSTVRDASGVIRNLAADQLLRRYSIQGYRVTGYEAATQVITHFGVHAGQIMYVTKMKRGIDLGFTKLPPVPELTKLPANRRGGPLLPIKI